MSVDTDFLNITKHVSYQSGFPQTGESVILQAVIKNTETSNKIAKADVETCIANVYRIEQTSLTVQSWVIDRNYKDVEVPLDSFDDSKDYNFEWIPKQLDEFIFPKPGIYYIQIKIKLAGGNVPLYWTYRIFVE